MRESDFHVRVLMLSTGSARGCAGRATTTGSSGGDRTAAARHQIQLWRRDGYGPCYRHAAAWGCRCHRGEVGERERERGGEEEEEVEERLVERPAGRRNGEKMCGERENEWGGIGGMRGGREVKEIRIEA